MERFTLLLNTQMKHTNENQIRISLERLAQRPEIKKRKDTEEGT